MNDAKLENEALCEKINELKIKVDKQEQSVKRIQNANKNLLEDKTEESEFNEKCSMLSDSIRKTTDDTIALQAEMDKRESQYNELMRTREEISKKKQLRGELQQNLTEKNDEKWKQSTRISVMEEYIDEAIYHSSTIVTAATSKRPRLSAPAAPAAPVSQLKYKIQPERWHS